MKKKLAVLLAGVVAVSSFAMGVMSKNIVKKIEAEIRGDFTIYVDGKKQTFRDVTGKIVEPVLYEGTTYLPVRAIGELMGKTVIWDEAKKRIDLNEEATDTLVTDADVIINAGEDAKKPDKDRPTEMPEKVQREEKIINAEVEVTLEEAKATALKKAGLKESEVKFIKAKLDKDDGRWKYEIEFRHGYVEYEAEIDAETGAIIDWEKDI